MQLVRQGVHILAQLHQAFLHCLYSGTSDSTGECPCLAAGIDCQHCEALGHVVMQLACKARALLFVRVDQPPAQVVSRSFRATASL